jgi:ATP-dependent Clp protease ATP-binding subunit ClpC
MRKDRAFSRVLAGLLSVSMLLSSAPFAAAAVVSAPELVPTGMPALGASAAAPAFSAPVSILAPALAPSFAAPSAVLPSAAAPAIVAAPVLAAVPVRAAAPVAAAPALRAAAVSMAAADGPRISADGASAAAGRAFDLSAPRPADDSTVVLGATGARAPGLTRAAVTAAPRKSPPPAPLTAARVLSRARAQAPRYLLAAGAILGGWALAHFGVAPAAVASPFVLLAGTLGTSAWAPTPAQLEKFLAKTLAAVPVGGAIDNALVDRVGREMDLDAGQSTEVLGALMERGDVGVRDNRAMVVYGFGARERAAGSEATPDAAANRMAAEAVRLLNSGAPLDHAHGLALAGRALASFEKLPAGPALEEAKILRANLALEHIGDLFRLHRETISRRPDGDAFKIRRMADLSATLNWLDHASFSRGKTPALPRDLQPRILSILQDINPRAEDPIHGAAITDAYIEAFDQIERYPAAGLGIASAEPASDSDAIAFALVKKVMPGERIPVEEVNAAAKVLGWDNKRAYAAMKELGGKGHIAIMNNGVMIQTSLAYRPVDDEALKAALDDSIAGVRRLNSVDPIDHLRAVARLDSARNRYAEALRGRPQSGNIYEETNILFANAVVEAAGDALRALVDALGASLAGQSAPFGGMEPSAMKRHLHAAQEALAWQEKAYYSADKLPDLTPETARAMREALDLRAFRLIVNGKINGDMDIVRGTRLVRAFIDRNAEGGHALPGMTFDEPATAGGFRPLKSWEYKALTEYGTDLTKKAADGLLRPMIGRKAEIRQMLKTLLRVEKNNPLVIGEKGVGKTAIVNGLAQMIAEGAIPQLRGKNVIKLDLTKIVAGTSSRGMFEERMQRIIDEAKKSNGRVILFIDEIHMIVGAGDGENATDAAQILKDSLADGSISMIGATTLAEFRKIEKDGALMRRFNPIKLAPPTKDEAEAILEGVKPIYEKKHLVTIALETVKSAIALASRYVTDRHLPDSALDLMDDASAEVELRASEAKQRGEAETARTVTPEDIAREISLRTGIPAGKLNEDKKTALKALPAEMKGEVIGQDEAVEKVAEAVQRGETGFRDPKQPIASFVFLGPTGVGKTELARALARRKFGSEKNMLRIDMSEYMEKISVSRLISAPPGYVGHDEGGQLTEPIRRNPYQVVLFDEIEKAHADVFDVLLQVLEDGRLTDGQGRTVDFSNTIIIMTSNIGGSLAEDAEKDKREPIGFRTGREEEKPDDGFVTKMEGFGFNAKLTRVPKAAAGDERKAKYLEEFKKKYRPEFVNRVGEDGVIVFNELKDKAKLDAILTLRLKALEDQLHEKGLKIALTPAAREEILTQALAQSQYGARPIKQIVDRKLNNALKDADLEGRIADGDRVLVDWTAAGGFHADKAP